MDINKFHEDLAALNVTEDMLRDAYQPLLVGISYEKYIERGERSADRIFGLCDWDEGKQSPGFWANIFKKLLEMDK